MSLIPAGCIAGVSVYVTLALIEATDHMAVLPESVGIVLLLCGLGFLIYRDTTPERDHVAHRWEMVLLIGCITLFFVYAGLRTGGFL